MSDETTDRRRRGRPRAAMPGTTVSTWLPQDDCDHLIKIAHQRDQSLSSIIREKLVRKPSDKD